MKIFKVVIVAMLVFLSTAVHAQVGVVVSAGTPPPWGPAGYTSVRYYYLPDVQSYYDVQTARFIYYSGGTWVRRSSLPASYRSYDLYSGYKVVMTDYSGDAPYANFKEYKVKYAKGYKGEAQRTIGERPGKENAKAGLPGGEKQKGPGHKNNKK